ncbi:hypothetical protein PVAND_007666 [Polypedilum vanderplanki]|uniref:CUB domain-containing protein n=1 Tax=Polypedilum vanderplanki TaxID=319348 RepID=A0A9J6C7A3_POLVA|nr:hypothetical protein PVAND_007666 [Polypedilum vanderplanki]
MKKIELILFFIGIFSEISSSQNVRPLPKPLINIHCGQKSFVRHVNLVPNTRPNQNIPATCTYRIHAISGFICQMRLDFQEFSLLPPEPTPFPRCISESMTVGNVTLCGVNNGQHIYVPINPLRGERFLDVTINTQQQLNNFNPRSTWKISVHQFECPLGQARKGNAAVQAPQRQAKLGLFSDWVAPLGCLQYFNQPNGTVESFNLNNGVGPYIGDMNYAICFRRLRENTSIRFIPMIFRLGYAFTTANNTGYDDACYSVTPTIGRAEDFIFIPNAIADGSTTLPAVRASRFCGESVLSQTITSSPPGGPFMIYFNSDQLYEVPDKEEIGFRFQYEIA